MLNSFSWEQRPPSVSGGCHRTTLKDLVTPNPHHFGLVSWVLHTEILSKLINSWWEAAEMQHFIAHSHRLVKTNITLTPPQHHSQYFSGFGWKQVLLPGWGGAWLGLCDLALSGLSWPCNVITRFLYSFWYLQKRRCTNGLHRVKYSWKRTHVLWSCAASAIVSSTETHKGLYEIFMLWLLFTWFLADPPLKTLVFCKATSHVSFQPLKGKEKGERGGGVKS